MWNCPYANASFPTHAEVIDPISRWGPSSCHETGRVRRLRPSPPRPPRVPRSPLLRRRRRRDAAAVPCWSEVRSPSATARTRPSCTTPAAYSTATRVWSRGTGRHTCSIWILGEISFKESADTLFAGDVADTAIGRIGVGVRFDMRFPELAAVCANRGASMLVYPGAFNTVTGPLHWELLQRARAVDNQCFVLTCSPRDKKRRASSARPRTRRGAQHRGGPVRGGSGDDGRKRKARDVRVRSGANRDAEAEHAAGGEATFTFTLARGQEAAVKKRDFLLSSGTFSYVITLQPWYCTSYRLRTCCASFSFIRINTHAHITHVSPWNDA